IRLIILRLSDPGEKAFLVPYFRSEDIFNSPRGVQCIHCMNLVSGGGKVKSSRPVSNGTAATSARSLKLPEKRDQVFHSAGCASACTTVGNATNLLRGSSPDSGV